jgi:hypothetical protein
LIANVVYNKIDELIQVDVENFKLGGNRKKVEVIQFNLIENAQKLNILGMKETGSKLCFFKVNYFFVHPFLLIKKNIYI